MRNRDYPVETLRTDKVNGQLIHQRMVNKKHKRVSTAKILYSSQSPMLKHTDTMLIDSVVCKTVKQLKSRDGHEISGRMTSSTFANTGTVKSYKSPKKSGLGFISKAD